MAEFNSCANLIDAQKYEELSNEYDNLLRSGRDPFAECMSVQNALQKVYTAKHGRSVHPDDIETKGELITFLKDQKEAFDDEFRELIESVHGMSRPESERSSGWKKWKSDYDTIRAEGVNEGLSLADQAERSFEMIDMMHFVINKLLATHISAKDLYIYYMLKNKENFERQQKGY